MSSRQIFQKIDDASMPGMFDLTDIFQFCYLHNPDKPELKMTKIFYKRRGAEDAENY